MITILQQILNKETLLGLIKLIHMNALQTRKALEKDVVEISEV